jgi:hypothetical protein
MVPAINTRAPAIDADNIIQTNARNSRGGKFKKGQVQKKSSKNAAVEEQDKMVEQFEFFGQIS